MKIHLPLLSIFSPKKEFYLLIFPLPFYLDTEFPPQNMLVMGMYPVDGAVAWPMQGLGFKLKKIPSESVDG